MTDTGLAMANLAAGQAARSVLRCGVMRVTAVRAAVHTGLPSVLAIVRTTARGRRILFVMRWFRHSMIQERHNVDTQPV